MTDLPVDRPRRRSYTLNGILSLITLFGIAFFIVFLTVPGGIETKALASIDRDDPDPEPTPCYWVKVSKTNSEYGELKTTIVPRGLWENVSIQHPGGSQTDPGEIGDSGITGPGTPVMCYWERPVTVEEKRKVIPCYFCYNTCHPAPRLFIRCFPDDAETETKKSNRTQKETTPGRWFLPVNQDTWIVVCNPDDIKE